MNPVDRVAPAAVLQRPAFGALVGSAAGLREPASRGLGFRPGIAPVGVLLAAGIVGAPRTPF